MKTSLTEKLKIKLTSLALWWLRRRVKEDPEWAWGWHCQLAMTIKDRTPAQHEEANKAAGKFMRDLFDLDTAEVFKGRIGGRPVWDRVRDARFDAMRRGHEPDTIILHPDVLRELLRTTYEMPYIGRGPTNENPRVHEWSLLGMRVIEVNAPGTLLVIQAKR